MGVLYHTMIREISEDFGKVNSLDLEQFLKNNEGKYKEKYQLPEVLFYLNLDKVLSNHGEKSVYFSKKLKESHDNDFSSSD